MKRSFQHIVHNKDGTFSGIQSVSCFQRICIFVDSCFTIGGYYEAEEDELIELLFVYYKMNDGVVFRRLFERCSFSFVGFTRAQIDDVMQKLSGARHRYSFTECKVLCDGAVLDNYALPERDALGELPPLIRQAAAKMNRENQYNLKEMTIETKHEKDNFNQVYHQLMKLNRAWRKGTRSYKKRRLSLPFDTSNKVTT